MQVKKLEGHGAHNLLGIDIGRGNECDGCGLNEGIFRYKYAVGDGTKPSYGNDRYGNQNKVKQKNGIAISPVAVKPYPQHVPISLCCCFMGLSSAADAALFLKMVCGTVALVWCLHFVVSMGPGPAAPAAALFLGWQHA